LGVLEGDGEALQPTFEVDFARVEETIGGVAEAGLLMEAEFAEGEGFGAEAAKV
jgi:hypothetical protein